VPQLSLQLLLQLLPAAAQPALNADQMLPPLQQQQLPGYQVRLEAAAPAMHLDAAAALAALLQAVLSPGLLLLQHQSE
jgi:hypothetical protein